MEGKVEVVRPGLVLMDHDHGESFWILAVFGGVYGKQFLVRTGQIQGDVPKARAPAVEIQVHLEGGRVKRDLVVQGPEAGSHPIFSKYANDIRRCQAPADVVLSPVIPFE